MLTNELKQLARVRHIALNRKTEEGTTTYEVVSIKDTTTKKKKSELSELLFSTVNFDQAVYYYKKAIEESL